MQDDIRPGGDGALQRRLEPAPIENVERQLHHSDQWIVQQFRAALRADRPTRRCGRSFPPAARSPRRVCQIMPLAPLIVLETMQQHGVQPLYVCSRHRDRSIARATRSATSGAVGLPSSKCGRQLGHDATGGCLVASAAPMPCLAVAIAGGGVEMRDAAALRQGRVSRAVRRHPAGQCGWRCRRAGRTVRRPAPGLPAARRRRSWPGQAAGRASHQRRQPIGTAPCHGATIGSASPRRAAVDATVILQRVDGAAQVRQIGITIARHRRPSLRPTSAMIQGETCSRS